MLKDLLGWRPVSLDTSYIYNSDDFQKWAADKPPELGVQAYWDMVAERTHATRLEF